MKSILQPDAKECFLCHKQWGLEEHHIYAGTANRKISERNGFKCYLCKNCHTGNNGAQYDKELNLYLKQVCQAKYEETHSRDEFRKLIGKSYL